MRIRIVTEGNRIKRRISEKIAKYGEYRADGNGEDVYYEIAETPSDDTDINFYVDYNGFLPFKKSKVIDVGYVTHIHADSISAHERETGRPFMRYFRFDYLLHMGWRTHTEFARYIHNETGAGYPSNHMAVVGCGVESALFRPRPVIGIVQNGECTGKGLGFMLELVEREEVKSFKWIFQGVGWDSVTAKMKEKGIEFESRASLDYSEYPEVYRKIDYLFVPSLWEGGPLAVLEAECMGVPIISADVGFVNEMVSATIFQPGNVDAAIRALDLTIPEPRHDYRHFCDVLNSLFERMIDGRTISA